MLEQLDKWTLVLRDDIKLTIAPYEFQATYLFTLASVTPNFFVLAAPTLPHYANAGMTKKPIYFTYG